MSLLIFACGKREPEGAVLDPQQAEVASGGSRPAVPTTDPVAIATRWLNALRDTDPTALAASTRYPFELQDDGGNCSPHQTASGPAQLPAVLNCLLTDSFLIDLLRTHESSAVEPLPSIHLASWAQKWHVTPPPGYQIVSGFFTRQDARFNLDLWVDSQGVRAVYKSGVNGSREIEIARGWLDAVRARDFERLSRVTSYPFETRDKRREALCGNRTAKAQADLRAAVDCLFRGDLLHRALVDSPSPGFTADEPNDTLPNWIAPWWREKDHAGLQRVSTMVATVDGYEFDFQMLIARDGGVRVVWKLGSFESRD